MDAMIKILVTGMKIGIAAVEVLLSLGATSAHDGKTPGEIEPHLIKYFKSRKATCFFGEEPRK